MGRNSSVFSKRVGRTFSFDIRIGIFFFSNELKTRLINFVGCAIWVVYGFVVGAYSTSFMNGALIIVHIVKLTKMFIDKRKKNAEQEKTSQNGLQTESNAADKTDTADTNQQNTNK